jgi:transposase InsO family protein
MILTATDKLWRTDITYIRLRDEFVFLAVILDAYSRRVIGWALGRTMEDSLTLTALRMALAHRVVGKGLVHHSDRGSQSETSTCCKQSCCSAGCCADQGAAVADNQSEARFKAKYGREYPLKESVSPTAPKSCCKHS